MELLEGYLYHIKEEFFDLLNDPTLMDNKQNKRPTYFVIKDDDTKILWFIPLSRKIEKYKILRLQKIKKYKRCSTILIEKIGGNMSAILIQNAFPTIEKYIDHIHTSNDIPIKVTNNLKEKILKNFTFSMNQYKTFNKNIFLSNMEININIVLKLIENDKI